MSEPDVRELVAQLRRLHERLDEIASMSPLNGSKAPLWAGWDRDLKSFFSRHVVDLIAAAEALPAAQERIAELEAERDQFKSTAIEAWAVLEEANAAFDEVAAERERLRAALEPFAWFGSWLFARDLPDDTHVFEFTTGDGHTRAFTRGQFKAAASARAALREHEVE